MPDHMGVATTPGDTAFTRTGAISSASPRVKASRAAFTAPCSTAFADGRTLRKPEMKHSDPPSRTLTARATWYAPQNLLSMVTRASTKLDFRSVGLTMYRSLPVFPYEAA
jgi:hypothetical protein